MDGKLNGRTKVEMFQKVMGTNYKTEDLGKGIKDWR